MAEDPRYQTFESEDGRTWVEITTAPNSDEAQLIQGFLEAEGVDAQIEHAEANILPATFGKLGDVRVYVPAKDEKRALDAAVVVVQREWEKLKDDDETLVTDDGVAAVDENAEPESE